MLTIEEIKQHIKELEAATNRLACVRNWCEIPDEVYAGINGVIDDFNSVIESAKKIENKVNQSVTKGR